MWRERDGPALSFRPDAAGAMAGAIFMSNTLTREQCFKAGVFGLPLEYESFVHNVKKGMPLFLFDYSLHKLYGVFEAASDGGLDIISKSASGTLQRSYPAQVRINIIWKCRPLNEDEFFPAIEENYYQPRKFYFDLSYEQVVKLYKLFDDKRVERPINNCSESESLETKYPSKGTSVRERMAQNVSHSNDHSDHLIPDISAIVRKYSTPTSMHTVVPTSVDVHPNTSMPLGTGNCGAQIAPIHSKLDQAEFPSQSELFKVASIKDGVSTQVSAPCSLTRHHQLVATQSYPVHYNYAGNILSSGRITQDSPEGAKFVAKKSYPLSHNSFMSNGSVTQNTTYGDTRHVSSTSCLYAPPHPNLSIANPQGNADPQDQCDLCIKTCHFNALDVYPYACQRFNEEKALLPAKLSQQVIPAYPEVIKYGGNTVLANNLQKNGSTDYIQIPECDNEFNNDRVRHGINSNASDSSDLDNDIGVGMSDPQQTKHSIGADSNTKVIRSCQQSNVFSRLSRSQQPPSQEFTGPTLSQLVSSLSQKSNEWSKNRPVADDVDKHWVREQAMDRPCAYVELDLPVPLEFEPEEGTEPQLPFLNFKRRSEAWKVDGNLGKETSGKAKRRKLVRPIFGENIVSTSAGKELEGNFTEDMKHSHLEVSGNQSDVDLNRPASVDNDPVKEGNSTIVCSSVINVQTEELCGSKPNCSAVAEAIKEQDPSFDSNSPAQKFLDNFDVAELNKMDESKLRIILTQASQALGKLTAGRSNNSEEAISSICGKDIKVKMGVSSDGSIEHQT
ncbi:hypothetical protein ACP4OV_031653 [Aristida adscensionis]